MARDPILVCIEKQAKGLALFTEPDRGKYGPQPCHIKLSCGSFSVKVLPMVEAAEVLLEQLKRGTPRGKDPEYSMFSRPRYGGRYKSYYYFRDGPWGGKRKRMYLADVCKIFKPRGGLPGYYETRSNMSENELYWNYLK